jgi:hypothetical protein
MKIGFHRRQKISRPAERLSASQEGPFFMEFVGLSNAKIEKHFRRSLEEEWVYGMKLE